MKQPFLFALLVAAIATAASPPQSPADESRVEQQLLQLVNHERESRGLPTLKLDERLTQAARAHTRLLAAHGSLSHQFEGELDLSERVAKAGVRFNSIAENVSLTSDDPPADSAH